MNFKDFKKKSFEELEKKAFDAMQRIFPCETELMEDIPIDEIITAFKEKITTSKKPFLFRVAGQSGSGKSSQIVPSLQEALKKYQYVKISVGDFAPFHPKYDIWKKTDSSTVREKTNGFALKALVLFYKHCIENRVNVLLDMTLLEPEIDIYLMGLAKNMNYQIHTHLLCVPKKVSDSFIRQRQKQTGRYVKPSSYNYFFKALNRCLKALIRSGLFDTNDKLILWSHYTNYPIKQTHLKNPVSTCILQKYQEGNFKIKNPKKLLKTRIKWMKLFLELSNV
ncbi:MAG: hypothetical protein E7013_00175 [Alphaproteobacteria bacterium]|nr:hypothetical protein [Alphaproteobacteria bacterium]